MNIMYVPRLHHVFITPSSRLHYVFITCSSRLHHVFITPSSRPYHASDQSHRAFCSHLSTSHADVSFFTSKTATTLENGTNPITFIIELYNTFSGITNTHKIKHILHMLTCIRARSTQFTSFMLTLSEQW
jgi:hypothetical protein